MLSQTVTGRVPCFLAMASAMQPTAAKSTCVLVGLAGVSTKITDTRPLPVASSAAFCIDASSTPSTKPTAPMPRLPSVFASSVSVPP